MESAVAIAGGTDQIVAGSVVDGLMSLVSKSLVVTDVSGHIIRYRLLTITRAFATEKLIASEERAACLSAHAQHFYLLLEGALVAWESFSRAQWLSHYGGMIDDARAAMDWAYGPGGNIELGAALTVVSLPFGFQLSLIDEFKKRATLALESLSRLQLSKPIWEMRINNALVGLLHSTGAPDEAVLGTIERALELARQSGIVRNSIEPLTTRSIYLLEMGQFAAALQAGEELGAVARDSDDPFAILLADRVGAQVNHNAGNHQRARLLAERVLRHPARALPLAYGQIPVDRQVSMRIVLARISWIEGRPEQAQKLIAEGIHLAASDGPSTMCQILALAACPIAFWRGDLQAAQRLTDNLLEYSRRYTFNRWYKFGLCYQVTLHAVAGEKTAPMHAPNDLIQATPAGTLQREILGTVSELWIDDSTRRRAQEGACGWLNPELLRATAAIRLRCGTPENTTLAEDMYLSALAHARQQGALAWQLRIAMSLARLWREQGRIAEASQSLRSVYDSFNEGHNTLDLKAAQSLLEELQPAAGEPLRRASFPS